MWGMDPDMLRLILQAALAPLGAVILFGIARCIVIAARRVSRALGRLRSSRQKSSDAPGA